MDHTGHSTEAFQRGDVVSLDDAQRRFDELRARRFAAFRADGNGQHTMLRKFDPDAEVVLWCPPLAGG